MALHRVSADLLVKGFPFNVESFGSTVIINQGFELNRTPYVNRGQDFGDVSGLPQAYYMHNVVPTTRGYRSVHFPLALQGHSFEDDVDIEQAHIIRNALGDTVLFSPAHGENLFFSPLFGGWNRFPFVNQTDVRVTLGYVKGTTYISYEKDGLYTYDFEANTFNQVFPAGIDYSEIIGVAAGGNYLILFSDNRIYWSSATDPLDFVPSTVTGAGSSNLVAVKGQITAVLPIADGFIVYTTTNAVGSQYSGVPTNPWIFREIPGSSGVGIHEHVSYESNEAIHIAWTAAGFQRVTFRAAEPLWPELSDTIGSGVFSDYDFTLGYPVAKKFAKIAVKVSSISSRYTAISVKDVNNPQQFLHSYVWDWGTQRWGRVRFPHTDIIDFRTPEFKSPVTYNQLNILGTTYQNYLDDGTTYLELGVPSSDKATVFGDAFGLIQEDGSVYKAVFHPDADSLEVDVIEAYKPRIWLGRYRLRRSKDVVLQETQLSTDIDADLYAITHDKAGGVVSKEQLTDLTYEGEISKSYDSRVEGESVSIELAGRFNLANLDMEFSEGGRRHGPRST